MKYKFCSVLINTTKYDVTFATMCDSNPQTFPPVVTPLLRVYVYQTVVLTRDLLRLEMRIGTFYYLMILMCDIMQIHKITFPTLEKTLNMTNKRNNILFLSINAVTIFCRKNTS